MSKQDDDLLEENFTKCVLEGKIEESLLYQMKANGDNKRDGTIGSLYIKEYRILKHNGLV